MQNQKLCLKWNNHMSNMLSLLGSFQQKDMLVDVTISCQGQNIKAHKIILSACSPYFQNIFMENPCQHPIIIINGMKFEDITAILNFMYKGEVNVSHDGLSSFLQAAEALKVKGLAEVCGEKKGTNSISQEVQQSELNRPQRTDTPPRKRPRNRKRSLSDSNRSDDEGLSRKHREPSSPEVHELSGDESFTGDNSSNGPPFNSISRVPQNVYSRSHQSSSNMGGEDDDEYDVESNKMLDTTDSNVSMNNTNTDNNLRIERIMGNATEIESSSMADPESPPDIKPIINFGESSAGPSESGNLMLYNEQSQPGPSNVQDSSLLQHDNSHAQALKKRGMRKSKRSRSLSTKTSGKCSIQSMYLWRIRRMVNWSPPPLDGEDDDSMNAHKQWLKNEWLRIKYLDIEGIKEITKRMELCFPYRRNEINSDVSLHYLKDEYPFMFTYGSILKEFQMLMSVDVEKTFLTNAFQIAPNLMKFVCERSNSEDIVHILNFMPSELKPKDEVIACVLILPYLFSVSSSSIYNVYDENMPVHGGPHSIQEGPHCPHVAVMGNPFTCSQAYVVAEGEIIIECSGFIEAIIACMAIYYCCNIKYPEEAIDTYHFIQTQFLKLVHLGKLPQKIIMLLERIK